MRLASYLVEYEDVVGELVGGGDQFLSRAAGGEVGEHLTLDEGEVSQTGGREEQHLVIGSLLRQV